DYDFDDSVWSAEPLQNGEFWRAIFAICQWPAAMICASLLFGYVCCRITDAYLKAIARNEEKSEVAQPKTLQAERSDYVDTLNNDNQEYDRDGVYDFEHTITFGHIKK
ncbi:hypothetical protein PFISCL1PPCAC_23516, partial [Pristionchus fissidentatus]